MKYESIILILSLLFFVACDNFQPERSASHKKKYDTILAKYPEKLTNHFPKSNNLKSNYILIESFPTEFGHAYFFYVQTESTEIIKSITSNNKLIPQLDSSFVIINKFKNDSNTLSLSGQYWNYDIEPCVPSAIPIPNFHLLEEFNESTPHRLNADFSIFLIEAEKGKWYDNKYHKGDWHMPKEWNDGYSRGYAISEKENVVIYWMSIW